MDTYGTEKLNSQQKSLKDQSTQNHLDGKKKGCRTFLLLASVVAAVSGFMLGYEMGLISGAMLQLREALSLTCQRQEMVVSSLLFGALLVSLVGGFVLDRYGRKASIVLSACAVVAGTLVVVGIPSYPALIAGRALVGMAVALSGAAACLYIAEIAPKDKRGLLVCLYELMVVIGILLGFGFSYAFAAVPGGWKYMFAVAVPPAALQAVTMLFLPVSPRFLMKSGKAQEARRVLARLRDGPADEELQSIQSAVREESQYGFLDLFRSRDNIRTRLMIGVALAFFQQATGQPNVLLYASTILKSVGFHSNEAATLASTGLGVVKVLATVPAVLLVDRVGSKAFLCVGSVVMAVSLTTLGAVTLHSHANMTSLCQNPAGGGLNQTTWPPQNASASRAGGDFGGLPVDFAPPVPNGLNLTNASATGGWTTKGGWSQEGGESVVKVTDASPFQTGTSSVLKWLSLVSLLVYVTAFSISLGPMVYVVLSEIFPLGIRGKAVSVVSAINWGTNLVISLTFLTVTDKIGLPNVIFTYAAMSFALLVFVILYIPETKGRSLEQISKELAKTNHLEDRICYRVKPKTEILISMKQEEENGTK
ncbi:solute carrier family 2, facilitated glucose transporter member 12 [Anguilla rostrata]|uniref:solute carrier family 2, facilitated glucose transporter member 12 n=1 Tax=Anguilla rostrata TaxID=7938 RepID=UPI0030CA8C3D